MCKGKRSGRKSGAIELISGIEILFASRSRLISVSIGRAHMDVMNLFDCLFASSLALGVLWAELTDGREMVI